VGPYEIRKFVAKGGMGVVLRGVHKKSDKVAAIKLPHPELVKDERWARRFEGEIKTLVRLVHLNLVRLQESGREDSLIWLAMDWVEGDDLSGYLKMSRKTGGHIDLEGIGSVIGQIIEGLRHLHLHQIVHRDLKPSNLLVGEDGILKLADFGLAKSIGEEESSMLTATGTLAGTGPYMAPEQWMGLELSGATDVWALGVIWHELVAGKRPELGKLKLKDLRKNCPDTWTRAITGCLQQDPEERWSLEALSKVFPKAPLPEPKPAPVNRVGSSTAKPRKQLEFERERTRQMEAELKQEQRREKPKPASVKGRTSPEQTESKRKKTTPIQQPKKEEADDFDLEAKINDKFSALTVREKLSLSKAASLILVVAAATGIYYWLSLNEAADDKAELDRLRDQVESMDQLKSLPFNNSSANSLATPKTQETVKEGNLLRKPEPSRKRIHELLRNIQLERFPITGTIQYISLREVLLDLHEIALGLDKEGINIIATPNAFGLETAITIDPPMRNITLGQALEVIVKLSDRPIKYSVEEWGITFSEAPVEGPRLKSTLNTELSEVHNNTGPGRKRIQELLRNIRLMRYPIVGIADRISLKDILLDLRETILGLDKEGINIIATPNAFGLEATITIDPPMRNITLGQALEIIVKLSDKPIKYSVEEWGITFSEAPVEGLRVESIE
jgi:serine/threonine protein kinase